MLKDFVKNGLPSRRATSGKNLELAAIDGKNGFMALRNSAG
jgi:hypothetical protein